jgi:UDP-N-acetylmuramate dehydrogenase
MRILEKVELESYNTFRVKAKARKILILEEENDIFNIIEKDKFKATEALILGEGSNILITRDIEETIIILETKKIREIKKDKNFVYLEVDAGVAWDAFVRYAIENNYGGIENLILIPGKVGAAPIQNIGAYGTEAKETIEFVETYSLSDGKKKIFSNIECMFDYRDSVFKKIKNFIITKIVFKLSLNPVPKLTYEPVRKAFDNCDVKKTSIKDVALKIEEIRKTKLPDWKEYGNAGSFFKNPTISFEKFMELKERFSDMPAFENSKGGIKIPAAYMIEKCGWKGKRIGNVRCYEKQPLVIVNCGNASGEEILSFANLIAESVKETFNIELEKEVNII